MTMTRKLYAGIGPLRKVSKVLSLMSDLSGQLYGLGWKLRSGRGDGADKAIADQRDKLEEFIYGFQS